MCPSFLGRPARHVPSTAMHGGAPSAKSPQEPADFRRRRNADLAQPDGLRQRRVAGPAQHGCATMGLRAPVRRTHEARPAQTGWKGFSGTRAAAQTLSRFPATGGLRRGLRPTWRASGRRFPREARSSQPRSSGQTGRYMVTRVPSQRLGDADPRVAGGVLPATHGVAPGTNRLL
jgi:hypothetical protein